MRRIYQDEQQEVWTYKRHRFSLTDLRVLPASGMQPSELMKEMYEKIMEEAVRYPFEVADITNGHVLIIGKFQSGEEAIEFIRAYCDEGLHKQRDQLERDI